uniref:Candidate secreted effector n=1 Tax=Meloidogyne incognita TaxID=6306 RepID=A0A914M4C4_MELIC
MNLSQYLQLMRIVLCRGSCCSILLMRYSLLLWWKCICRSGLEKMWKLLKKCSSCSQLSSMSRCSGVM